MKKAIVFSSLLTLFACDALQDIARQTGAGSGPPSKGEITSGIREALIVSATNAVEQTSQQNGFYGNESLRIPFPPEAERVASTLRNAGMGQMVDKFVKTMNHGAEKAAEKARPVFVDAIKKMTLRDVYDIWQGSNDAATQYLKRTTSASLKQEFRPVIQKALNQVELTKYWNPVISSYNKIPLSQKVNPDLDQYVLDETLDGLFQVMAREEAQIRENPAARVSEILEKVFGYNGPVDQQ